MNYTGPYCYSLVLAGSEKNRIISKKDIEGKTIKFTHPVTRVKTPKIYILKSGNEIVYIGYASQPIGARLNYGIKISGEKGYHGYKWKHLDKLELLVFVFNKEFDGIKDDDKYKTFVEAIEAELVYKVRNETGLWPKYQNEIHFNNHQRKAVLQITTELYMKVQG